ncbi:acylphosphatase [Jiella sp. MQZ9-1]|uniref:Acylphosphatase n=1 Tax=Jiella flava TaxID=2816857 RepID=A0A939G0N7_9HYPH|nr:acylphosphatase [Jiella flava]MBO0663017.1 acylphosphatase [Jiella flava]MCD2471436.1 acylphosphatase [Jiella flava]
MSKSVHVEITGRVQGVGFRAWTQEQAKRLQLSGWVRNRRSGAVEAVFSGDSEAVEEMLKAAEDGPAGSSVKAVNVLGEVESYDGAFEVRRSE